VLVTSFVLFGCAVLAYSTFYYTYIPIRGLSVPVYLQFDASYAPLSTQPTHLSSKHVYPFGIANLKGLVSRQKYDVVVDMVLPRSERNLDAGNWMVGVEVRGPGSSKKDDKGMMGFAEEWDTEEETVGLWRQPGSTGTKSHKAAEKPTVLARSRRPALLTYRSWMTELAYRVLRMPLYVVGWGQEAEKVNIRMMEGVEFDKGWRNVPASLRFEVRSKTPLEVYNVAVRFVARLSGLRWVMYHYKFTSALVFTSLFWAVEMTVLLMTWGFFTVFLSGAEEDRGKQEGDSTRIKMENSEVLTPKTEAASSAPPTPLSDTSRTFPTLSSQQPLRYVSSSGGMEKMKEERSTPHLEDIPARTEADADVEDGDEDEDADFVLQEPGPNSAMASFTDSGIGTGMESRDGEGARVVRRSNERMQFPDY
jgi:seipin